MTPEEFRAAGHTLIDWIADFRAGIAELPVQARVSPGAVRDRFPSDPPPGVSSLESLLSDIETVVVPGMTHIQHPSFFGFFPANASLSSVLGDLTSSGLGGLGITWQSCPALTEVEEVMCDWMRRLVGLSARWRGTIYDTASTASLVALLCARERASHYSLDRGGLQSLDSPLVVYTSPHAHSSVKKGALLAGFGEANFRQVDVDSANYAMKASALARAIEGDMAAGRRPAAVVATVGTTGTTAIDPVGEVVEVAARHDLWVHVDAAMAGSAMLLPECRWMWEGAEAADSISWNPHKWMGTVLDCSLFYVSDVDHLVRVMSTSPSYLRSTVDGEATQYRDWGIPLGRRFRSLKLWFQLRLDGIEAIRERLRRDLDSARWLAQQVAITPGWRLLAPVPLQTLCVRHEPAGITGDELDAHTLRWATAVNESGRAYLTPAQLDGRWMVRVSIGAEQTERADIMRAWDQMRRLAEGAPPG